ncbi:MAG TPA: thioredoxin domain-containing protein, partial [Thermoanaerobaculia bacterium]|nr:thioredoxin domain-containing protein [Thermoanaerobaculia bacterium]
MNPRDPNSDPSADPHAADRPANRLAGETSPYLLLHAHNPVDWMPWGEEALARAKSEDRPIFLSVGYSTCYWCHVMERESFSDPAVAELMNRSFVNVKLDREERPDLDEIYMTATQILTGHGGWPNSVFLTPDLAPFYAGTYFPPEDRHGRPGFRSLLIGLAQAWEHRRDEVEQQSEELAGAMRRYLVERFEAGEAPPPPAVVGRAVAGLGQRFDAEFGGFGGAPKFPTPSNLELLDHVVGVAGAEAEPRAAAMLAASLDAMARGGLQDQLGGGFHRYATDRAWRVPHFEKMLYDNALLVALYARHHARTGDEEAARVVRETVAFLDREMGLEGGGFASAIDAETDGHEGAFYVWRRDELEAVLGAEDFAFLAPVYGFEGPPFFEDDHYVLHLPLPLAEQAKRRRTTREELLAEMAPLRERLLAARGERERPLTDDKVLADWNGMAIAGLAEAGRLLGETAWVERAARAADFVLGEMRPEGRLLHAWRGGEAKVPAMLADYVWMVRGLLALHAASGEERWLASAVELAEEQRQHLADEADGGYFNAGEREDLLYRAKEIFDGAVPAANAVAALNALALAEATGDEAWREDAERTLRAAAPLVEQFTDGARTMVVATAVWHGWTGEETGAEEGGAGGDAAPAGALESEAAEVVDVELEVGAAGDDGWKPFVVRLTVESGWHLNAAVVR